MNANPICPECGAPVELVVDGFVVDPCVTPYGDITWVPRRAPFGACTGCEFCIEVLSADVVAARRRIVNQE